MSPRADISEFSYGYALIEELALQHRAYLTAAPVLPSLQAEGKLGAGWDVRLDLLGVPAFLQFKVARQMTSRRAKECGDPTYWDPPFYRMDLRAPRISNQHQSLVALEANGHVVYYVAPAFHTPAELNEAYRLREVAARSIWLQPSSIALADDGEHSVGFESPSGRHCVCSQPTPMEASGTFDGFTASVRERISQRGDEPLNDILTRLGDDLTSSILARTERSRTARRTRSTTGRGHADGGHLTNQAKAELAASAMSSAAAGDADRGLINASSLQRLRNDLPPLQRTAYLTRTFFGAELIIVGPPF